ncbi:MAG: hypothetical protein ABT00_09285 [Bordetella sp. SCN 68-11]|nr:MAG: hypothetical protein ABT00_09285 [Bordetella sp. SCN 68-11]
MSEIAVAPEVYSIPRRLGKGSQGPLEIEGAGFKGTYPGHWMQPSSSAPGQNPGAAEGRYTMTVTYPASRAFLTDLVDPMPCLTNQTGVQYDSLPVTGDVNGSGSAPICAQPAFHLGQGIPRMAIGQRQGPAGRPQIAGGLDGGQQLHPAHQRRGVVIVIDQIEMRTYFYLHLGNFLHI